MILFVFVSAMMVSIVLERQARRHRIQRAAEYQRLAIPVPPPRPKLKRMEAWLNVGLGILLGAMSLMFAGTGIEFMDIAKRLPDHASTLNNSALQMIEGGAFFLASGIALTWLGWKAVRENSRYESGTTSVAETTKTRLTLSDGAPQIHRSIRFNLTAAIAAGAFCAGILTGYLLLSREPSAPATVTPDQATVSLDIQAGDEAGFPTGFADELERRFETQLGSLPGVRVVRPPEAAYLFKARLGRNDGFIVVSWNVIRMRDNTAYFNRNFTIPVEAPGNPLRIMISSLSSTFGEKRIATEFERIFELLENSLD